MGLEEPDRPYEQQAEWGHKEEYAADGVHARGHHARFSGPGAGFLALACGEKKMQVKAVTKAQHEVKPYMPINALSHATAASLTQLKSPDALSGLSRDRRHW